MTRPATTTELDSLGRPRPPVTRKGYRAGRKPANAGRKFAPELLTNEEMQRLLAASLSCSTIRGVGERNHAMLVTLWRCGLRCGEALALMPEHIDLEACTIRVPKSKTPNGLRTVGIDPVARESLERWMAVRAKLGITSSSPVFCAVQKGPTIDARGRPLGATQWRETIKKLAKRAGITKRVHSHGLRHQFAWEAHRNDQTPLAVISRMLGHGGTQITHRYIDHTLSAAEAVEAMKRRQWVTEDSTVTVAPAATHSEVAELSRQVGELTNLVVKLSNNSAIATRRAGADVP